MVADELRRQADDFIELSELAPLIARNPSERAPRPATPEADDAPRESLMRSA
ncbi:MAG: NYN domain-containing protein, partial [Proteobacteria bacterium]|nr:NYN domain-containing protein [Pseudomonadota bacterium]